MKYECQNMDACANAHRKVINTVVQLTLIIWFILVVILLRYLTRSVIQCTPR